MAAMGTRCFVAPLLFNSFAVLRLAHQTNAMVQRSDWFSDWFHGADKQEQTKQSATESVKQTGGVQFGSHGCADLKMENNGTHYTTMLQVGTPGQLFEVVVDTGSNSLIVPSCVCQDEGYCRNNSACFRGTNKSSTFNLPGEGSKDNDLQVMMITFGSGTVEAIRAMDVAEVGGLKVNMSDGILLMTNQALRFPGKFEGILGLGLPERPNQTLAFADDAGSAKSGEDPFGVGTDQLSDEELEDMIKKAFSKAMSKAGSDTPQAQAQVAAILRSVVPIFKDRVSGISNETKQKQLPDWFKDIFGGGEQAAKKPVPKIHQPKSFLEQAGIERFSMCFNKDGGGTLRMGDDVKLASPLKNMGVVHWGLGLHGISVGSETASNDESNGSASVFCSNANLSKGQKTPCAMIPDSGTTAIMGPKHSVNKLFESICDAWPRCKRNHTALLAAADAAKDAAEEKYGFSPWKFDISSKAKVFSFLLADCDSWIAEDGSVDDEGMPELSFRVSGEDGARQTLSIPAADYIMMLDQEEVEYTYKTVPFFGKIPVDVNHTGKFTRVCAPSISDMEYKTQVNGDVWIMGVPLFSRYDVGYDLKEKGISFTSLEGNDCSTCKKLAPGFLGSEHSILRQGQRQRTRQKLRTVKGPLRKPNIDVNSPL